MKSSHRRGMTLMETLIVLGIVVLGIGLLLPATYGRRGASARAQCGNNLKQWGLHYTIMNRRMGHFLRVQCLCLGMQSLTNA
jgi:Tfp pilus assembly protein PilV